jgi:hypothetical protein
MAAVQQMPPEAQQQIAPILAKLQNMPTEQREQHLSELLQELQQSMGGQQGMGGPQQPPGMEAQAADEDLYAAAQQQGLGALGGQEEMPTPPQDPAAEDAQQAEASAIEAKNELDNVKVTLSVRELLDLIGKGSATASLLKVKQLADTHKQKMDQTKAKAESEQQKQTQEQQQQAQEAQQGMMGGGGIYSAPMGG